VGMKTPYRPLKLACLTVTCGIAAWFAAGARPVAAQSPPPAAPHEVAAPADVAAPPTTAKKTASGLAYRVLKPGKGKTHPEATDNVRVNYTGWTTDGKMFESSSQRGGPATFPLNSVIAGCTEGVQLMTEGEKTRFWIPENLAYKGQGNAPRGMLVFDVELLSFVPGPKTPPDVAAPPKDAKRTASGLAYKVLKPGSGKKHPSATSTVTVHYSGWTTDGKPFDSSVQRGEPATFALNQVIAGWTEGVQLMTEGEKTRFWIPEGLAYKGQGKAPRGMLVFEIELLSFHD